MQTNENSIVGTTLQSKYQITELLSEDVQGGQGKVYFVKDVTAQIEKKYILKQFIPNYHNEFRLKVGTRLFTQEAKILQKLGSHSQIPQILDYFTHNNQFFLVQEWIDGQDIRQELRSKKSLSQSELIALLKDATEVLSFVHHKGYIHRDIKPANLIRNKYDGKIYLIDFGAVKEKIIPENINNQGKSTSTVVIGTSGYMPMEQLRGQPEFSSDIYALGMVAIQSITGLDPSDLILDSQNNPQWREHILTATDNFNQNLLDLIDRMVRGYHKERYQSATKVLEDLHQLHLQPEPSIEPFERAGDRTVPDNIAVQPSKSSRLLWVMGAFGTVVIGVGGVLLFGNTEKYTAYENVEHGIQLDRPEKWTVEENWNALQPEVRLISALENNRDEFREKVTVSMEDLATPLTLNEYTTKATEQIASSNTIVEAATETTFANKEGRKIIFQEKDGNKKRMQLWIIKNQKAYIATFTAEADKFDRYQRQAETIIDSLNIN